MKSLAVTEINTFSGGMNNIVAPYLIPPDEATALVNVDIRRGSLTSMPHRTRKEDLALTYWYQYKRRLYQFGMWRSNVIWDNKWYWSDGILTGKVYEDGTEAELGIEAPTHRLTTDLEDGGIHTGEFKYTYTFFDNIHGVESAPAPLTMYANPTDQNVKLNGFDPIPDNADTYRIYRIGGYLPYFMLVDAVTPSEVSSGYVDKLDDSEIKGTILDTLRNGHPPKYIHHFTELNGRMFGAVESKLFYSAVGNPDSWYISDFIVFKGKIRGLAKAPGGLLVMGDNWTYLLRGSDPSNFILRITSDVIGLKSPESINYMDTSVVWLSNHGMVVSDGYTINQLTSDKIETIEGIHATGTSVINNVYYMSFKPELYPSEELLPRDDLYPDGAKGTAGVDQGILVMDFKRGRGYAYKIIKYDDIEFLGNIDNNIGISVGEFEAPAYECGDIAYRSCLDFTPCSGFELSYLNDETYVTGRDITTLATLEYISPLFVAGAHSTMKEYDRVRLLFRGIFSVKIIFDNDRVVMEELIESENLAEYEYAEIGIPNEDDKAYSIRYIIEGRGTIKSLQHSFIPRDLN